MAPHTVPTIVCEQRWGKEGDPGASVSEFRYAAEPWGPELDGLSSAHRFGELLHGMYRLQPQGPPKPERVIRLEDWGVWWRDGGY
ncbi:hypothetical protein HMI51_02405 [Corallococcus coralloides]|nr:hypothetical protein [Corallococcus coralloides]